MKMKIYILFTLIMFACLPIEVQAVEHNFPAGSIIIPMDQFYQPADVTPDSGQQDGNLGVDRQIRQNSHRRPSAPPEAAFGCRL